MKLTDEKRKKINDDYNALLIICENSNDYNCVDSNKLGLIHYAAALGDLEKIKLILAKGATIQNIGVPQGNTALHYAVKYENFDVADFLLAAGAFITEVKISQFEMSKEITEYYIAQLKKAALENRISNEVINLLFLATAKIGNWEMANALLELGANINFTDHYFNFNALYYSVINNHIEFARKLLEASINVSTLDFSNNSILHFAAQYYADIIPELLQNPDINKLLLHKNIYGHTPFDAALIENNIQAGMHLSGKAEEEVKLLSNKFNNANINISQRKFIMQIKKYFELTKQESTYLNEGGVCNGLVLLRYLDKEFYKHLKFINSWDGAEQSLSEAIPPYKDRRELIEHWLSNIIWLMGGYQTMLEFKMDQTHKAKQFALFKKRITFFHKTETTLLARKLGADKYLSRQQFGEYLQIFSKLPEESGMLINSEAHVATCKRMENKFIEFYDPNFEYEVLGSLNPAFISELVFREQIHVVPENDAKEHFVAIDVFKISDENSEILTNNNYFLANELVDSKNEHDEYIEKSPNKFSQLHVAVITKSIANIDDLLKKPYVDVNAKNYVGKTPLQLAIAVEDHEIICKLLSHKEINQLEAKSAVEDAIWSAVHSGDLKLLNTYTPFLGMLMLRRPGEAIEKWFESLFYFSSKLYQAATNPINHDIISALLKSSLPLCSTWHKNMSNFIEEIESPLRLLIRKNVCLDALLDSMNDMNIADYNGKTALHYAVEFDRVDFINKLIARGANIHQKDKGRSANIEMFSEKPLSPLEYAEKFKHQASFEALSVFNNKHSM